jgi:hypothetical protein
MMISMLFWGTLLTPDPNALQARRVKRILEVAEQNLSLTVQPIAEFHLQGTLESDPRYQQSDAAKATFTPILDLALCARLAQEPLRSSCRSKAASALSAWASVYVPTGDPINENAFRFLFEAADLLHPELDAASWTPLADWIRKFAVQGDALYLTFGAKDGRRVNNWMAWRILIRAQAGTLLNDTAFQDQTRDLLAKFLPQNFQPDGRTTDFIQRDALHYHIYDLQPLVELALLTPKDSNSKLVADVASGLNFMRPYFEGKLLHEEWVHSTVPFDVARCKAGQKDYCPHVWDPKEARQLLRLSRALIPSVRTWTDSIADDEYDPVIKLFAAIYGDSK